MSALLRQYFDIAFLMGRPQDLPGGERQMQVGLALGLATYVAALAGELGTGRALVLALLDVGITGASLYAALLLTSRTARFAQAFGGYCGAAAFVNLAALPIYLFGRDGSVDDGPSLAEFVLLMWTLCLLGHVIRHTFEVRLATSILAAFVYFLVMTSLIGSILPPRAPPVAEPGGAAAGPDPRAVGVAAGAARVRDAAWIEPRDVPDASPRSRFSDADRSSAVADRVL